MKPIRPALVVLTLGAPGSFAQPPEPEVPAASASQTSDAAGPALADRPPLGWLSNPADPPKGVFDALVSGKIHLNNNFRIELADSTGRNSSTAITNRLRLGYETKAFHGFSGFIEMENVATPDEGNYWVPATGDGTPDRTVVADPPGTEVNQAFGRFSTASLGTSGISLELTAGRQRIQLDDDRFIGNVGWRQFEQTYDSVSIRTNFGVQDFSFFYAYVWGVQRVFGPDGPNPDSDSHLINLSYRVMPELKITPFAYLLDFSNDEPLNSSDSFGVRLTGDLWQDADDSSDVYADYELTYARQADAGANPIGYQADFFAAQFRVTKRSVGHVLAGYQLLGSDDGNFGFRFPLGTNHKFQGFDDLFLVTPSGGLQDLYAGLGADLPHGIKASFVFHQFWSDEGGTDVGSEYDMVASKQISSNWSVLIKAAFFDGHSGQPDVSRVWMQTTFKF